MRVGKWRVMDANMRHRYISNAATSTCVCGHARSCARIITASLMSSLQSASCAQARTLHSDAATAHYCTVLTTPSATAALRARCTRARQLGRLHSNNCHQRRDVERRWSKWSCTTRGCAKAPQILLRPQRLCSQRCTTCIASRDKRLRCGPSVWLTYSEAKMRLARRDRSMSNYFKFRFDEFKNVDSQYH